MADNSIQNYDDYGKYLLHHWLIEKKAFEQGVKKDPQLSMLYSRFMREGGIGQTDIVKLNMGNSYQIWNLSDGGTFPVTTEAGKSDVVDSSTIDNHTLVSRLMITGKEKRALESASEKIVGATLDGITTQFANNFTNNLTRMVAGDGTGALCYCTTTGTVTQVDLQDWDGSALPEDHWIWKFLYVGQKVDIVTWSTGALGNASDTGLNIATCVPGSSYITLDASTTGTYTTTKTTVLCFYQPRRTSTVYQVEPNGLRGMIYSGNTCASGKTASYLGKSATTYVNWTSPIINCSSESLDVRRLDQAIYASTGNPNMGVFDTASMAQFRYEADAMKKLAVRDDMVLGQPRAYYMGPKGPIALIDSVFLTGQDAGYLIDTETFRVKGTAFTPKSLRGGLELLQTSDLWFDDFITEFENICINRGANVKLKNLKAAW